MPSLPSRQPMFHFACFPTNGSRVHISIRGQSRSQRCYPSAQRHRRDNSKPVSAPPKWQGRKPFKFSNDASFSRSREYPSASIAACHSAMEPSCLSEKTQSSIDMARSISRLAQPNSYIIGLHWMIHPNANPRARTRHMLFQNFFARNDIDAHDLARRFQFTIKCRLIRNT